MTDALNTKIGNRIREIRLDKNLSQEYIASKLGITPQAFSLMERGETQNTPQKIEELAKVMNEPIESFLKVSETVYNNTINGDNNSGHNVYYNYEQVNNNVERLLVVMEQMLLQQQSQIASQQQLISKLVS